MSGVRRVIVGVSGSPGSLQALRRAADLARLHQAALVSILAWVPPGGDLADRSHPSSHLRKVWARTAEERLRNAIDLALGGMPDDVLFDYQVARGETGPVLVGVCQPDDMLVIGAGRRGPLARALASRVSRYCLAHAPCPVLAVPPPTLARVSHGIRGWAFRHRGLNPEDVGLPAAH